MPGGFGGPGGGFLVVVAVVALPLFLSLLKPPLGPPKQPGKLVRVESDIRAISGGGLQLIAGTIQTSRLEKPEGGLLAVTRYPGH